ncbi:MAG TPA: YraN family protein [Anaerolineales bacterium]|nr:YraN family protein [Anaerolineales bacterium]
MDDRMNLGRRGELLAADYLASIGYSILEKNHRTPYGEVDLIAIQAGVIVFVEIKTRRTARFGWPEQAISRRKRERMVATAESYLLDHPGLGSEWRVDVISIQLDPVTKVPEIVHFEHALQ